MKDKITAREIIDTLGLEPHPEEGGYYRETHRSPELHAAHALPGRYAGERCHSTAIYYLLTPQTYSHMHRLVSDEIFHFYMGDPCEMLLLHPDGSGEVVVLGHDLLAGQRPQVVVPRGSWQGMRLLPGGGFGLMGCTVAPGFEFADYAHGVRAHLLAAYPDFADRIVPLTAG
ncbi:cupin domain-containing protein [Pseudodesulfovibrio pelocollis]|uniref:cupin domain-containing protein n=1 Tax=Pseudodesulfovibrio pelocollis TaxID=3051432 RepID=UPI00255A7666|nr:cupin domain-containing protein [Pseudodesulfovibrio sp. SB368]